MSTTVITTKRAAAARRAALLKKIGYDPERAEKAWKALAGIWKDRKDIDPNKVRKEAWTRKNSNY